MRDMGGQHEVCPWSLRMKPQGRRAALWLLVGVLIVAQASIEIHSSGLPRSGGPKHSRPTLTDDLKANLRDYEFSRASQNRGSVLRSRMQRGLAAILRLRGGEEEHYSDGEEGGDLRRADDIFLTDRNTGASPFSVQDRMSLWPPSRIYCILQFLTPHIPNARSEPHAVYPGAGVMSEELSSSDSNHAHFDRVARTVEKLEMKKGVPHAQQRWTTQEEDAIFRQVRSRLFHVRFAGAPAQ